MREIKQMKKKENFVHPYIPNSAPDVRAKMLKEIGIKDIEELYQDIPAALRLPRKMNLPEPLLSEYALKCHLTEILEKNKTCEENISFLGGGCWQHYVPVICDEINQRSEFLTAYAGEPYEDHGRFQALFEYESLMGELLDMDVVNVPTYDWCQAASTSIRMAGRITKRREILIADTVSPQRLAAMKNYCRPAMTIRMVRYNPETGSLDLDDLTSKISNNTAGIYWENPSYLGFLDTQGQAIADIVHEKGALSIVGVDPISLGVIKPPSQYGADIVCGDIQGFGMHLNFGGGLAGFIATHDEEKFVMEYPSRLFGITRTTVDGEYGFGDVAYARTSFDGREKGKEFVGTHAALWGITAGVYLSLMGPLGMYELGKSILQKSQYAVLRLSELPGVRVPRFQNAHFKEFVVDFSQTRIKVEDINRALLGHSIFGGKDLSREFPELGQSGLFCVTEIQNHEKISRLTASLEEILSKKGDLR